MRSSKSEGAPAPGQGRNPGSGRTGTDSLASDLREAGSLVETDHERRLVLVTSQGEVDRRRAFLGTRAARALAGTLGYRILFDLSGASVALSVADAYKLPRYNRDASLGVEEVALVLGEAVEGDWADFLQLTSANAGLIVRTFSDRKAALAALEQSLQREDFPNQGAGSGDDPTVLLVDDDPEVLALSCAVLRKAGFRVLEAETGEDGLALAKRAHPDLVLLDVMLPGADGLEICRRMRSEQELGDMLIALASGARTSVDDQHRSLASEPDAYIPRPVGNQELVDTVRLLLKKRDLSRS